MDRDFGLKLLLTISAVIVCLADIAQTQAVSCSTGETVQHNKTIATCTCWGNLQANKVNKFIRDTSCSMVVLQNCTIDKMVQQNDGDYFLDVHYRILNCTFSNWQQNALAEDVAASVIKYLEFSDVRMLNYSGWNSWLRTFEVDGKLNEMLRFDNSLPLVLNSESLFTSRPSANCEIVLRYSNMDLSSATALASISRMLSRFDRTLDKLKENEKALFLYGVAFESTNLQVVPALNLAVQSVSLPRSWLSFRGNLIQRVNADSFATYKLTQLRTLDLSNNQIQTFDPAAFSSFAYLQELDLSNNQLASLDLSALGQRTMRYFNVSNNRLSFLNWPSIQMVFDKTNADSNTRFGLDLHGNPWNCTCALYPLINAYRQAVNSLAAINVQQIVPTCTNGYNFLKLPDSVLDCSATLSTVGPQDGKPLDATTPKALQNAATAQQAGVSSAGSNTVVIVAVAVSIGVAVVLGVVATVLLMKRKQKRKEAASRVDTTEPLMNNRDGKPIIIQVDGHRSNDKKAAV